MDVWITLYKTHMANNLVKWWRTKFLNGYKQFSDCGDIKVSDTEELLRRYESEDENFDRIKQSQTPLYQEKLVSSPATENEEKKKEKTTDHIKLEEFLCDVSMDNTEPPGQEKQEFSFTLYDFDGHGKITKDDIAGLVTTIYEVLGSTVKVPHFGSKTIKVKLTVSPEHRSTNETVDEKTCNNANIRYKKDINVTIQQNNKKNTRKHCKGNIKPRGTEHCCEHIKTTPKSRHCCKNEEDNEEHNLASEDFSDICSRLSCQFFSEDECENDVSSEHHHHKPRRNKPKKSNKKLGTKYTIPTMFLKDVYHHQEKFGKNKKDRSSSLQRQELLEIIQANMENNLSFKTFRKNCPQDNQEAKSPSTESKHHHRHRLMTKTEASSPLHQYLANMVEPTQFYVDLACLQNATQLPPNYNNQLLDAVIGPSDPKTSTPCHDKQRKTSKIKTECDNQYQIIDQINEENGRTPKQKRNNEQPTKKTKKVHGVTGHTSSPHYLKHRNRQEDQARAMAQVVRWLEQEFSSNLTMKDSWERVKPFRGSNSSDKETTSPNTSKNVERHEHHHVHEHIHHHYHHYQEAPFVV